MSTYVGTLLTQIRERTDNLGFTEDSSGNITEGISDDLILGFLNDGQDYIFSRITSVYPEFFQKEEEISIVADQESYTPTDNLLYNNAIITVEHSFTGLLKDYRPLRRIGNARRVTHTAQDPSAYILRDGSLLLQPTPTNANGKIRVTYYRALDRLDKRIGTIGTPSGADLPLTSQNDNAITNAQIFSAVDSLGASQTYNLIKSSYSSPTLTLTVSVPATVVNGEFLVRGQYATTHSQLPLDVERWLKLYAQVRIFQKDSSIDQNAEISELRTQERDIIDRFSELNHDWQEIPALDPAIYL